VDTPVARLRLVYVDDSAADLQIARDILRPAGFDITTHTSARSAERDLVGADVVLVDYHMPGMHGGEVVQRFRSLIPAGQRTFFYLYTSDRTLSGEYRRLGFDGQLILKGNPDALLRQLCAARKAVALRQLRPVG
jgi:two-component system chemotaxis response regulator CheY